MQVACLRCLPARKPLRRFSTLRRFPPFLPCRTPIQSISDTHPVDIGHRSDPIRKLSDISPDDCPASIGTLSALNRNAVRLQIGLVSGLRRNTQHGRRDGASGRTLPYLDGDKPGRRRRGDFATCTADWWLGGIERNGSDPTSHGQWVDTDLLSKRALVEPRVPEITDKLIDLDFVATTTRELDVVHPGLSPDSNRIGNHGDRRTLTF